MISGFSVLSLALDAQKDIVTTQRAVSEIEIKKQQEEFGVMASVDENDLLSVSIQNQGQNPVEISSMWITNKTLSDQPAKRYSINYDDAFVSSGFTTNVLSSQTLQMFPDTYGIKVVTTLGSIKTVEFDTASASSLASLRAELITDPPDVIMGQNVTVAMIVTNTGEITINNVHPELQIPTGSGSVLGITLNAPSMVHLIPGESVMFSWDTRVDGLSGQDVVFNATAKGKFKMPDDISTGFVSDTSIIRDPADGGASEPDHKIINEELLARPKIFLTIPSPAGDSNSKALWGINIANPVNAPMEVSKVSITVFAPGAQNNDKVFAADCGAEDIFPATVSNGWDCPSENVLLWQNQTHPIIIAPNSTQPFLTKVLPGFISGNVLLESIVVQSSVFTSLGSFGKAGYQTAMYDPRDMIASVYLSDVIDSRNNDNIQSTRTGILPNSVQTFNIVFADLDNVSTTFVQSDGGRLIINVPNGWTDVQILGGTSGFDSTSVTPFGDGSSQIVGELSDNLGTGTNVADTIQFSAQAPNASSDQMYVMYILAQGQSSNTFSIGPLSEIVLQIDGS